MKSFSTCNLVPFLFIWFICLCCGTMVSFGSGCGLAWEPGGRLVSKRPSESEAKVQIAKTDTATTSQALNFSSYANFNRAYKPHNKLFDPEHDFVQTVKFLDEYELAEVCDTLLKDKKDKDNSRLAFLAIISSVSRTKAGKVLDLIKEKTESINTFNSYNYLSGEYIIDVMYYVSEPTYKQMAVKLAVFGFR